MKSIHQLFREYAWQQWLFAVRTKDKMAKSFWWEEFIKTFQK